jgi:ribonuclease Z
MARGAQIRLGDLTIEGWSRAGQETWFRVHPPGLAFDCGRGTAALAGVGDVFLSHGHLDHALGLPYLLSLRSLEGNAATRVFCPAAVAADVDALIRAAERLERVSYRYELVPLTAGERVDVGRDGVVEAFATDHVVPSLGFHLYHRKRRLAARFAGRTGSEIAALRQLGVDPSEEVLAHRLT